MRSLLDIFSMECLLDIKVSMLLRKLDTGGKVGAGNINLEIISVYKWYLKP